MFRHLLPIVVLALLTADTSAQEPAARVDQAGDPLPAGAVARLGTVRFRHPDWIRSLAMSPDGKTLASGGDRNVRVWEMPTGRPLKKFANYRDESLPGSV